MEQDTNSAVPSVNSAPDMGFSQTSYVMGGILVLIIGIVGGWYLMNMNEMEMDMTDERMTAETMAPAPGSQEEIAASEAATIAATTALTTQGTSDDLTAIDADMKATDMNSLGDPSQI